MKVTQEEMKLDILNIQEQVNRRLSKMDRRSRHQVCFELGFLEAHIIFAIYMKISFVYIF